VRVRKRSVRLAGVQVPRQSLSEEKLSVAYYAITNYGYLTDANVITLRCRPERSPRRYMARYGVRAQLIPWYELTVRADSPEEASSKVEALSPPQIMARGKALRTETD
jgi:hypothetical protein